MKKNALLLFFAISTFTLSCSKDSNDLAKAGTLKTNAAGKSWESDRVVCNYGPSYFHLVSNNGKGESVYISAAVDASNKYTFMGGYTELSFLNYMPATGPGYYSNYFGTEISVGHLEITAIDTTAHLISGTYSSKTRQEQTANNDITVSGSFTKVPYNLTK